MVRPERLPEGGGGVQADEVARRAISPLRLIRQVGERSAGRGLIAVYGAFERADLEGDEAAAVQLLGSATAPGAARLWLDLSLPRTGARAYPMSSSGCPAMGPRWA